MLGISTKQSIQYRREKYSRVYYKAFNSIGILIFLARAVISHLVWLEALHEWNHCPCWTDSPDIVKNWIINRHHRENHQENKRGYDEFFRPHKLRHVMVCLICLFVLVYLRKIYARWYLVDLLIYSLKFINYNYQKFFISLN